MASPSLILWPQEDSPSPPPPPPISKPKLKRTSKPSSTSKKIPQRGLGVAQLEQIRLQNKISAADRGEIEALPVNLPASVYGAPVAYAGSGQICYVPQFRMGYGPFSVIRSVLHEQYAMDRDRARASGELPSNQRVCVSPDLCQFCSRKKRVLSDDLGFDGGNGVLSRYLGAMDEERRIHGYSAETMGCIFAKEREIKEYDFFPHNSIKESNGGDFVFEEQTVGGSPSSTGAAANYVDLSLKLF